MIPRDEKSLRIFKLLFFGFSLKALGYLTVAIGIFSNLGNGEYSLKIIIFGILLVAIGWIVLIRAVEISKRD